MRDSIKREQSQASLNSAERENSRTKCKVKIQTMLGDIVVRLYDETPIHRDNFLKLAKEGYYDGTLFHRVIKDFMIQGGDPDSKGAPAGKMLGVGDKCRRFRQYSMSLQQNIVRKSCRCAVTGIVLGYRNCKTNWLQKRRAKSVNLV